MDTYIIETKDGRHFTLYNRTREELLRFLHLMNLSKEKLNKIEKKEPKIIETDYVQN